MKTIDKIRTAGAWLEALHPPEDFGPNGTPTHRPTVPEPTAAFWIVYVLVGALAFGGMMLYGKTLFLA